LVNDISDLVSGNLYVATNKEKLRNCKYFGPEDFGISRPSNRSADGAIENRKLFTQLIEYI
jgi:hypothetical protein